MCCVLNHQHSPTVSFQFAFFSFCLNSSHVFIKVYKTNLYEFYSPKSKLILFLAKKEYLFYYSNRNGPKWSNVFSIFFENCVKQVWHFKTGIFILNSKIQNFFENLINFHVKAKKAYFVPKSSSSVFRFFQTKGEQFWILFLDSQ